MNEIFVVWWGYTDGSACGFIEAFTLHDDAVKCCAKFQQHGDSGKTYQIAQVPFKGYGE